MSSRSNLLREIECGYSSIIHTLPTEKKDTERERRRETAEVYVTPQKHERERERKSSSTYVPVQYSIIVFKASDLTEIKDGELTIC